MQSFKSLCLGLSETFCFALYIVNSDSNFWNGSIFAKKEKPLLGKALPNKIEVSLMFFCIKSNIENSIYSKLLILECVRNSLFLYCTKFDKSCEVIKEIIVVIFEKDLKDP